MFTDEQLKIWEELIGGEPHAVLKKYRTEFGLTQKDVGIRMGLNCNGGCSTVADFESGKKEYVSFDFVLRYVKSLYPKEEGGTTYKKKNGYMEKRIREISKRKKQ